MSCKICQEILKTDREKQRGICSECLRAIDELVEKRLTRQAEVLSSMRKEV